MRQKKIGFWKKIKKPVSIKDVFTTQVKVMVAELAWTVEELMGLPWWMRRIIYHCGMRFLKKQGCTAAPEQCCAEIFGIKNGGFQGVHTNLTAENVWECMDFLMKMNASPVPKYAYIKCSPDAMPDETMLETLCTNVEALSLCVEDKARFVTFAEQICIEYGIYPDIYHSGCLIPEQAILIDLNAKTVRIDEERAADGIELAVDLHGYRVNQAAFLGDLPLPYEKLVFVSWTKGKKRLTRQ